MHQSHKPTFLQFTVPTGTILGGVRAQCRIIFYALSTSNWKPNHKTNIHTYERIRRKSVFITKCLTPIVVTVKGAKSFIIAVTFVLICETSTDEFQNATSPKSYYFCHLNLIISLLKHLLRFVPIALFLIPACLSNPG